MVGFFSRSLFLTAAVVGSLYFASGAVAQESFSKLDKNKETVERVLEKPSLEKAGEGHGLEGGVTGTVAPLCSASCAPKVGKDLVDLITFPMTGAASSLLVIPDKELVEAYDGDSIRVYHAIPVEGERVGFDKIRLVGIDTPELDTSWWEGDQLGIGACLGHNVGRSAGNYLTGIISSATKIGYIPVSVENRGRVLAHVMYRMEDHEEGMWTSVQGQMMIRGFSGQTIDGVDRHGYTGKRRWGYGSSVEQFTRFTTVRTVVGGKTVKERDVSFFRGFYGETVEGLTGDNLIFLGEGLLGKFDKMYKDLGNSMPFPSFEYPGNWRRRKIKEQRGESDPEKEPFSELRRGRRLYFTGKGIGF